MYGCFGTETPCGIRQHRIALVHFGSWVKVTDLKNNRSVIVRINDRGPVPKNRIIDLSYSAAKMLDMDKSGVHPVRLDLIETSTIMRNETPM
jgi:rare lipoprotein A